MEINNLMLNDYVMIHCFDGSDIVIKVTEIEGEGCTVYGISKQGSHWSYIEDVKPIPLTPEILEKNGFVKINTIYNGLSYQYFDKDKRHKVIVSFHEGDDITNIEIDSQLCWLNSDCSFLHQLQHALKLCGVEKEIVL